MVSSCLSCDHLSREELGQECASELLERIQRLLLKSCDDVVDRVQGQLDVFLTELRGMKYLYLSHELAEDGSVQSQSSGGQGSDIQETVVTEPENLVFTSIVEEPVKCDSSSTFQVMREPSVRNHVPMTLPSGWPSLDVREGLEESGWSLRRVQHSIRRKRVSSTSETSEEDNGFLVVEERSSFMLRPDCWLCTVSECVAMTVLVAEMCMLPFFMAFDVELRGNILALIWVIVCFWTWDLILSLNTGVWTEAGLELRRWVVFGIRLRGWTSFDFVLVMFDWASLFMAQVLDPSFSRVFRLAKASKLVRAAMLLRLVRMVQSVEKWLEKFVSGDMGAMFKIFGLMLAAVWLSHVLGCIWYALGSIGGHTWLETRHVDGREFRDVEVQVVYLASVHWAITQMTLGSVDIAAVNDYERIMSILVMVFGLLFSSTLVSSVSATLISSQIRAGQRAQRTHNLELYLKQNKISPLLAYQVRQTANASMRKAATMHSNDVEALQFLPKSLQDDLRFAVFRPNLRRHRLFSLVETMNTCTARAMCCDAMDHTLMQTCEDLFVAGGPCSKAFCLIQGEMTYTQHPQSSPTVSVTSESVEVGSWLCEAALWVHWIHVGQAKCSIACQLLVVDSDHLLQTLKKHQLVQQLSHRYCIEFHKRVCAARPPLQTWPTDLCVPQADFEHIAVCLPKNVRAAIGLHVLTGPDMGYKLQQELLSGKASLVPGSDTRAQRIVYVIAFQMTREDGRVLVQLGISERDDEEVRPTCQLPGGKYSPDVASDVAAQELLDTKMAPLSGNLDVRRSPREVDESTSHQHDMTTKYFRTVYFLNFRRVGHRADRPLWKFMSMVHSVSKDADIEDTSKWDMFTIEHNERTTWYAWLTSEEVQTLGVGSTKSDKFLKELLTSMLKRGKVSYYVLAQDGESEFELDLSQEMEELSAAGDDDTCKTEGAGL